MVVEVENNAVDDILLSSDDNPTSSYMQEYFTAVENGRLPAIPISNQQFISSMRNLNGETLLIAAARM